MFGIPIRPCNHFRHNRGAIDSLNMFSEYLVNTIVQLRYRRLHHKITPDTRNKPEDIIIMANLCRLSLRS